jgi:hypothetical protein
MLPLVTLTDYLALMWFLSLGPHSDRSFLIYYSDLNPFYVCRPVVASVKVYDIIHRLDWQWSWQQNLVHARLFFICFPYVRKHASRRLLILLSAQFDRLEYPLLMILRIYSWLSRLI